MILPAYMHVCLPCNTVRYVAIQLNHTKVWCFYAANLQDLFLFIPEFCMKI
jgi:hypothetical protein